MDNTNNTTNNEMTWYTDGPLYVCVQTGQPQDNVRVGIGDTYQEAFANLEGTPSQSVGRDCGERAALDWAAGAGWIRSRHALVEDDGPDYDPDGDPDVGPADGPDYDPDGDPADDGYDGPEYAPDDDPPYGTAPLPAGLSSLPAQVLDCHTNKLLAGRPSPSLIEASLDAEPTGAVPAYYSEGMWHYVRPDEESLLRLLGEDVWTVYVAWYLT